MSFDPSSLLRLFQKHTFPTLILKDTPASFHEYLWEDGIVLSGEVPESTLNDNVPSEEDEEDGELLLPPEQRFAAFHEQIKWAIAELGGAVFPKLGTSSPKVTHERP